MRRPLLALFAFSLSACGDEPTAPPAASAGPDAQASIACAAEFRPRADGAGCAPIVASGSCRPGTRAALGQTECAPVGVGVCPTGFAPHGSGWGCDAVVSTQRCTGATRERLGETGCTPITPCDAAFPPPDATLFVDASFPDAKLDATHFKSVRAAVQNANNGSVIAVESGTYRESVPITRRMTIVGRCAEKVRIESPDGEGAGIDVDANDAAVRNLTVSGFEFGILDNVNRASFDGVLVETSRRAGIWAAKGAAVSLTNVVVRGTRLLVAGKESYGVLAESGAHVVAEDLVAADNDFSNVGAIGATLDLKRSIIRDGRPTESATARSAGGLGGLVGNDGTLVASETLFSDNQEVGVYLLGSGKEVKLTNSTLRGTQETAAASGAGFYAQGGTAVIQGTTFLENGACEIAGGVKASLDLRDSTAIRVAAPKSVDAISLCAEGEAKISAKRVALVGATNLGVAARQQSHVTIDESLVHDTRITRAGDGGYGMAVTTGSTLAVAHSTIESATAAGMVIDGGTTTLDGVLVRGTRSRAGTGGNAVSVQSVGSLVARRSAFVDNRSIAIGVINADARIELEDSVVVGTKPDDAGSYGIGVFLAGSSGTLRRNTVAETSLAALVVAAAGGFAQDNVLVDNEVAIHTQGGTTVRESGQPSDEPLVFVVAPNNRLVRNRSRFGTGTMPVPTGF